jgi:LPXTG-motif cell wall-anchored protein
MIPWLAALGSGTLAALGAWLWYRRRHPASLNRYGRSRMAN